MRRTNAVPALCIQLYVYTVIMMVYIIKFNQKKSRFKYLKPDHVHWHLIFKTLYFTTKLTKTEDWINCMDDALRWYVTRTQKTSDDAAETTEKMKELKSKHTVIQLAALIAVFLKFKTTNINEIDRQNDRTLPLSFICKTLQVQYQQLWYCMDYYLKHGRFRQNQSMKRMERNCQIAEAILLTDIARMLQS